MMQSSTWMRPSDWSEFTPRGRLLLLTETKINLRRRSEGANARHPSRKEKYRTYAHITIRTARQKFLERGFAQLIIFLRSSYLDHQRLPLPLILISWDLYNRDLYNHFYLLMNLDFEFMFLMYLWKRCLLYNNNEWLRLRTKQLTMRFSHRIIWVKS